MSEYLWWCGLVANAMFVLLVVWAWFILPAVEAISMVRWYKVIAREYPDVKLKGFFRMFVGCYEPFGRSLERTRCKYGYWDGVGKWRVYNNEDGDK
jgi:hypothetical protein